MYQHLIQLVEGLGRPRIVVLGDLMLDEYVYGETERISPEAPIGILRVPQPALGDYRTGGAGCVVGNLCSLGAEVALFSVLGADWAGDQIKGMLLERGAELSGLVEAPDYCTTRKVRYVGRAQHHNQQQVLRVDYEDTRPLAHAAHEELRRRVTEATAGADIVVLSDYGKGVVTEETAQAVIRGCRERATPVLVDPHPSARYEAYRGASVVTPNRYESRAATGIAPRDEASAAEAAQALAASHHFGAVVVTLDKQGAYLFEADGAGRMVPTRPREVFDNAGAGDMVVAAVALALAGGASGLDAVRLANVAAGIEVEKFGVQPVSRDEILADLLGETHRHGDKRRTLENLLIDLARHRNLGRSIVFTNGCFDLLHAGHIAFLEAAGREGDVLVVGVNTDAGVRRLKGPDRPVCDQDARARVLSAIEAVDYVVLFDEDTPARLIQNVRPDVLVKGEDWRDKGVVGRETVEAAGGRVVLVPLVPGVSTTDLLERIRSPEPAAPRPEAKGGET